MKLLAVAAVCFVAMTTTHGFGIGMPPFGGIGFPPFGAFGPGFPRIGLGFQHLGLGMPHLGLGMPHLGLGNPHLGLGIPSLGLGVSPLGSGLNQGLVHPGSQGAGAILSQSYGPGYIGELDAYAASSAAAPTTIAATAVAPAGPAVYDPAFMGI
ncbi:postacrosomal sheath WW domain-binding protein-like [Haliotis rufescens]|uniref:postacrosomal sheath WW domain-binding protein-like n=1 Tax=Haliotis rufescens TaxID=6454 RepID=UPI001EB0691A|nr:postacrosomal sheath WW domain-binding protein-like [Haliotis rufescens]